MRCILYVIRFESHLFDHFIWIHNELRCSSTQYDKTASTRWNQVPIFIHLHFSNNNLWTAVPPKWNFKCISFFSLPITRNSAEYEPPPDPAPPEIPPRAQSLLASLTKKLSNYTLKTNETGDMKHEEFIPQHQQGKANESSFNLLKQHVDKWPQTSFN